MTLRERYGKPHPLDAMMATPARPQYPLIPKSWPISMVRQVLSAQAEAAKRMAKEFGLDA